MRRIMLVLGTLALVPLLAACGSSGDDSTTESAGDPRVAAAVEASLSRNMEVQLQRQLGDRGLRVTGFRCAPAPQQNVECVVRARDSEGAAGTIGIAVVPGDRAGTAMAQFTGTSRRAWADAINRTARQQQAAARQQQQQGGR